MEKFKKLTRLTRAEMKKIRGASDCGCNTITCESDDLSRGATFFNVPVACGQANFFCANNFEAGSIATGCACTPSGC